jgi:hypothetical protein
MKFKSISKFLLWESMIILGLLVIIGGGMLVSANYGLTYTSDAQLILPTLPPTTTPMPTPSPVAAAQIQPEAIPVAAGGIVSTADGTDTMQWVETAQAEADLAQSYLYMILRDGTVFHGPMQFDLTFIPPGSTVIMTEIPEGGDTNSNFAINILPGEIGSLSDAETEYQDGAQKIVFKAGQQQLIEQNLQASHLLSFNLANLFPEGLFSMPDNDLSAFPAEPTVQVETPDPTATYVIITSTPAPENLMTAVAIAPTADWLAETYGTPTPLPENWVTPRAVTATPTPANEATAQFRRAEATAAAQLYGTPTPLPSHVVLATPRPAATPTPTATATPVLIPCEGELPPASPTPAATLEPLPAIPAELIGKIAFKSDRTGQEEIYVINPDGSGLALLTDRWPYNVANLTDAFSVDGRFRVFTKDAIRYKNIDDPYSDGVVGRRDDVPALYWYDSLYQVEEQLTHFGAGIAYEGVWSPTAEKIAFVSSDSGNDEIWVVNRDGSNLLQLTRDDFNWWDKHPSWSSDGSQLVFWSNRTGHGQIWVMNADGNELFSLSRTGFNDWDPVWIKSSGVSVDVLTQHIPYDGIFNPTGADRSCRDFDNQAVAQAFYLAAGGPYRDPHRLDYNNDGVACN